MIFINKLEKGRLRAAEIEDDISRPEIAKDPSKYQKLMKELALLRPQNEAYARFLKNEKELDELKKTLASASSDPEMKKLYEEEIKTLEANKGEMIDKIESMLLAGSDPNSGRDVIVEIRAGTGGEEASLFGANLYRMYSRYAADKNFKVEVLDASTSGKGGFKEVIFGVSGPGVYSFFKYESGIHRVQRVPETEANGRVHTSAVTVAVLPEADEEEFNISPSDLRIDVFRASGAGGQHVNKTESAVRITHIPTGVVVSCQDERSQHKNKAKAMRVLRARLYEAQQEKQHQELAKTRKEMVGSGDRSGKIRTYNFPDQRVTDHRIGLTLHALDDILNGHLDELVKALERDEKNRKLSDAA